MEITGSFTDTAKIANDIKAQGIHQVYGNGVSADELVETGLQEFKKSVLFFGMAKQGRGHDTSEEAILKSALQDISKNKRPRKAQRLDEDDPKIVLQGNRARLIVDIISSPEKFNISQDFFQKNETFTRELLEHTIEDDVDLYKRQLPVQIGLDEKIRSYDSSAKKLSQKISLPDTPSSTH